MSPREPPSKTMHDLLRKVNQRGRERYGDEWELVDRWQVERWTNEDLVPHPDRPGVGQGPGRPSTYSERHVQRITSVAILVRRHRSQDAAAIVLFATGEDIPIARVRRGYLGALGKLRLQATQAGDRAAVKYAASELGEAPPLASATERAEMAEPVIADRIRRGIGSELAPRLRELGASPGTGHEAVARVLASLALSAPVPLIDATLFARLVGGETEEARSLDRRGSEIALRQAVEQADDSAFPRAREAANRFRHCLYEGNLDPLFPHPQRIKAGIAFIQTLDNDLNRALDLLVPLSIDVRLSKSEIDPSRFWDELFSLVSNS